MQLVRESINQNYDKQLYESILNEKFGLDEIKNIVNKISDKKTALIDLIAKYNQSTNLNTKKYIGAVLILLYASSFAINNDVVKANEPSRVQIAANHLSKKDNINIHDVKTAINYNHNFKHPNSFKISKEGINLIKKHEGLKLTAYNLKDGKISIGYGHTGGKFKVGQKISKEQAERFFEQDIKEKEKDIHRMFREWEQRGTDIKITQGMYDALVSMSFNMGITGLRNTYFIEKVESKKFKDAAQLIPKTMLNDKFPGLKDRRKSEQELFSKDI